MHPHLAAALTLLAALSLPARALQSGFQPGAPGVGDPLFPLAGNGGYDVAHYALTLDYEPATNALVGRAEIDALALQNLSSFDLDLVGFTVTRVEVDGRTAAFVREGQELVITPGRGLRAGRAFHVRVDYAGTPSAIPDADGTFEGWIPTADGAFVAGEPQGSPGWYPVNDTPRDKATYDFTVTVPAGLTVMANGVLVAHTSAGDRTTWVWREADPMAPYLATVTLGVFDLTVSSLADGTPVYVAVDPQLGNSHVLDALQPLLEFYTELYGPYPFDAAGAIVDSARTVRYALETQTKPLFDRMPDEATLAHELAHMWFGDSVTPVVWSDLWLNEGFATWSEWIWSEANGGKTCQQTFDRLYGPQADDFWNPPPADPGEPALLFSYSVYVRGGMTLQALRQRVGDPVFFGILRAWAAENRHGNATTADFRALAERESGLDLGHFFEVWLERPGKPVDW